MQIDQLTKGIEAKFEQSRLVFWYDPEQSFSEEISAIAIDDVTLLDMSDVSVFETKKRIYRSHALRGNAALDAPRPESEPPLNQPLATSAINDAERGNELKKYIKGDLC